MSLDRASQPQESFQVADASDIDEKMISPSGGRVTLSFLPSDLRVLLDCDPRSECSATIVHVVWLCIGKWLERFI